MHEVERRPAVAPFVEVPLTDEAMDFHASQTGEKVHEVDVGPSDWTALGAVSSMWAEKEDTDALLGRAAWEHGILGAALDPLGAMDRAEAED